MMRPHMRWESYDYYLQWRDRTAILKHEMQVRPDWLYFWLSGEWKR